MQNLLRETNLKDGNISLHREFARRKLVKLIRKSARLQHHGYEIRDIGSSNPGVIGIIKFYRVDAIVGIRLSVSQTCGCRSRFEVAISRPLLLHHNRIRGNTQHNCAFTTISSVSKYQCFPAIKYFQFTRVDERIKRNGNKNREKRKYEAFITPLRFSNYVS